MRHQAKMRTATSLLQRGSDNDDDDRTMLILPHVSGNEDDATTTTTAALILNPEERSGAVVSAVMIPTGKSAIDGEEPTSARDVDSAPEVEAESTGKKAKKIQARAQQVKPSKLIQFTRLNTDQLIFPPRAHTLEHCTICSNCGSVSLSHTHFAMSLEDRSCCYKV